MKKLLLVDDDPNMVMSLEYLFKKENFLVYIARNGTEAINMAKEIIPDVMLLDVMMSEVDSAKVLSQFKSEIHLNPIKVICMLSKGLEPALEDELKVKADRYIFKPFSPKKLLIEVNALLDE